MGSTICQGSWLWHGRSFCFRFLAWERRGLVSAWVLLSLYQRVQTGGTPRNIWWGCAARFPKLFPIYNQHLHFPQPYLWPDALINILSQTCLVINYLFRLINALWSVFVDGVIDNDEVVWWKVASSQRPSIQDSSAKTIPNLRSKWLKTILFGAAHTYISHIGEYDKIIDKLSTKSLVLVPGG